MNSNLLSITLLAAAALAGCNKQSHTIVGEDPAAKNTPVVAKIDPATDTVVARYGPAGGSGSVAADDRAVWITAHDILRIWRLEPDGIIE